MSKNSETHSVCNKHNIGGKSVCCECSGKTDCSNMNTDEITQLVKELRMVANMINMGEKIQWGRETTLMDRAADTIETLLTSEAKKREEAVSGAIPVRKVEDVTSHVETYDNFIVRNAECRGYNRAIAEMETAIKNLLDVNK